MNRLVILGSKGGPAIRPGGPSPTSSLVEWNGRVIVIDCGLGVTRGLVDAGVHLRRLDTVLITHHHSDHTLELGALVHTAWTAGLSTPVRVFGPAGTKALWADFLKMMRIDIETRIADEGRPDLAGLVRVAEYADGAVTRDADVTVTALRNRHPPLDDSFALRLDLSGCAIVFSGDTALCPALADFAGGADILVHEAMLMAGVESLVARTGNGRRLRQHLLASHSSAEEAGEIAAKAGVRHLVLNHLIPADDPDFGEADWIADARRSWDGRLSIARDGMEIELPQPDRA
ncbi:MAG: MBL fold metallo-hydrolase [Flavobacteriaceae bacterium]